MVAKPFFEALTVALHSLCFRPVLVSKRCLLDPCGSTRGSRYLAAPAGLADGCVPDLSNFDRGVDELVTRVQVHAELSLDFGDVAVPGDALLQWTRLERNTADTTKALQNTIDTS